MAKKSASAAARGEYGAMAEAMGARSKPFGVKNPLPLTAARAKVAKQYKATTEKIRAAKVLQEAGLKHPDIGKLEARLADLSKRAQRLNALHVSRHEQALLRQAKVGFVSVASVVGEARAMQAAMGGDKAGSPKTAMRRAERMPSATPAQYRAKYDAVLSAAKALHAGAENKAMAQSGDLAARLKGLKKAQLRAVAKEVSAFAPNKFTAQQIRESIQKRVTEQARFAAKNSVASQVGFHRQVGADVDFAKVDAAGDGGRREMLGKVNAAIDKVAGAAALRGPATLKGAAKSRGPSRAAQDKAAAREAYKAFYGREPPKRMTTAQMRLAATDRIATAIERYGVAAKPRAAMTAEADARVPSATKLARATPAVVKRYARMLTGVGESAPVSKPAALQAIASHRDIGFVDQNDRLWKRRSQSASLALEQVQAKSDKRAIASGVAERGAAREAAKAAKLRGLIETKGPPGWSDVARAASAEARSVAAPGETKTPRSRAITEQNFYPKSMTAESPRVAAKASLPAVAQPKALTGEVPPPVRSAAPQSSLVSRAAGFVWRNQGPIALGIAASQAKVAYDRAWAENKTRKEALIEAGKTAAPTVGLVAAPAIGRAANAVGDVALGVAEAGLRHMGTAEGLLANVVLKGAPAVAIGAIGGVGVTGKAIGLAGKLLGKAALPIALGMAAYEGYQGYQKEGAIGAVRGVADSLTFGAASWLADKAREKLLPNDGRDHAYHAPRSLMAGKAYLNAAAAQKAQSNVVQIGAPRRPAAAPPPTSNGWVQDYTRRDGTPVSGYKRAA